jgi:hypothetical protein
VPLLAGHPDDCPRWYRDRGVASAMTCCSLEL